MGSNLHHYPQSSSQMTFVLPSFWVPLPSMGASPVHCVLLLLLFPPFSGMSCYNCLLYLLCHQLPSSQLEPFHFTSVDQPLSPRLTGDKASFLLGIPVCTRPGFSESSSVTLPACIPHHISHPNKEPSRKSSVTSMKLNPVLLTFYLFLSVRLTFVS